MLHALPKTGDSFSKPFDRNLNGFTTCICMSTENMRFRFNCNRPEQSQGAGHNTSRPPHIVRPRVINAHQIKYVCAIAISSENVQVARIARIAQCHILCARFCVCMCVLYSDKQHLFGGGGCALRKLIVIFINFLFFCGARQKAIQITCSEVCVFNE